MKKFTFPLGRALDWREVQARAEEAALERLYAELRAIESSEAALLRRRAEAERSVLSGASGEDLSALDSFRRFTVAEHTRLEKLRAECSRRIAAQMTVVTAKRRDVRLLERLRDTRRQAWVRELDREIETDAADAFLARVNAGR